MLKHSFLYIFTFAHVQEVVILSKEIIYTTGLGDFVDVIEVDRSGQFAQFDALIDLIGEVAICSISFDQIVENLYRCQHVGHSPVAYVSMDIKMADQAIQAVPSD